MVLWFGFVADIDNAPVFCVFLSSACTGSSFFLFPTLPLQCVVWGWARSWEWTKLGKLTWIVQNDIPYYVASCWGRGRSEWGFCLLRWPVLADWLGISLLVGGSEWLPLHHFSPTHTSSSTCLSPWFFSLSLFFFTFPSQWGRLEVNQQLCRYLLEVSNKLLARSAHQDENPEWALGRKAVCHIITNLLPACMSFLLRFWCWWCCVCIGWGIAVEICIRKDYRSSTGTTHVSVVSIPRAEPLAVVTSTQCSTSELFHIQVLDYSG